MTWSERQEQNDWLIKRQRIKERRRAGCLALNLSLTCLFLLSAPSFPSSLPLYRSLSDPSLSTCFSPSLACFPLLVSTPYSAPAWAIGQVSTNHSRTGAWGTAYAKCCLIFMSCYRGFKSLIRTAAQLSVPTAWPAGCVCTYSPSPWLSHLHTARTHTHAPSHPHTRRADQCRQRRAW